jgi:ABC-2 type transport system permease protein
MAREIEMTRGIVPALLPAASLWWREMIRFVRQPNRVLGAVGQPLVFWLLLGTGLGGSFRPTSEAGGASYTAYLYPGTLVLILLFTAIFSTISIIEDRREGFLQAVLVAPVGPSALVLGKVRGGTTLAVGEALVLVLLAPLVGLELGAGSLALLVAVLVLVAFALTSLGFLIAWRMDSTQGFHAIMNVFLIPMWLLSGAFFPAAGAPGWLGWVMRANPLTYGMAAVRRSLDPRAAAGDPALPSLAVALAVAGAAALAAFAAAAALARRPWGAR